MYELNKRSIDRMAGLISDWQIAQYAIKISRVDFGIPADGGIRSPERQKELFDKGLSKCDGVKTKQASVRPSPGFFPYVDGAADYTEESLHWLPVRFTRRATLAIS